MLELKKRLGLVSIKSGKGFTLIEIIIVLGIVVFIISLGSVIDLNYFKSDLFIAEQSTIVSTLQKARSRSMNNMFQSAHGVCFIAPNYIIFRDGVCDGGGTDETVSGNANITVTFPGSPVVFSQLAGTTTGATIGITDGVRSATTTINNEGAIFW